MYRLIALFFCCLCFKPALADPTIQELQFLVDQNSFSSATVTGTQLLIEQPDNAKIQFLTAYAYQMDNQTNQAKKIYENLIRKHPELPEPMNNLAMIYLNQNNPDKASQLLIDALNTHSSYSTAYTNLGRIYRSIASTTYRQAVSESDQPVEATKIKLAALSNLSSAKPLVKVTEPTIRSAVNTADVQTLSKEQGILKTIKRIQSLDIEQALDSTRELLAQYPKSRLGQMIYADLLLSKAGPLNEIGLGISTDKAQYDFKHEIQQRWQHENDTEHLGLIPENILFLANDQPYVIVVDQEKSRIYVFRNEQGTPILVEDYFISIGIKGFGKQKRGDQKTPVGIYHVTKTIDGDELPDLYGLGAFPISYPNVWDRRKNRTGDGIWIHGTPSNVHNRSPWASNGCIVVSNPDFMRIDKYINSDIHTTVIVAQQVKWLNVGEWQQKRQDILKVLSSWIADWESNNHNIYREHYSKKDFFANKRNFKSWDGHKKWVGRGRTDIKVEYHNLNIFNYPSEEDLVLMQFAQSYSSSSLNLKMAKEMYWRKADNRWQIVYEDARAFSTARQPTGSKLITRTP